ncbi:MAG: FtsX-like permease family protein [Candidatus Neomarinimicrobiota bacterium]
MNNPWQLSLRLLLWKQAQRHLNRSTLVSVAGIAAGSAVLVLTLSILNGFESDVWDSLARFEEPAVLLPISPQADPASAAAVLAEARVQSRPYAERKLVVQSGEDYRLVTARIVPDLDARKVAFGDAVIQELPYAPARYPVIIGSLLADRLGLLPGDELRLISPLDIALTDPSPPQIAATVQAIFEVGLLNFDEAYVFVDFATAEALVPRLASYSGLSVDGIDTAGPGLPAELSEDEWSLRTWETDHADLIAAMRMEKLGSTVVLFLIILVASFNATSTMVMSVMEKYREIGILRSLGASRRFIRTMFLRQGLMIGLVGVGLGVGLGTLVALLQTAYPFIPGPAGLTTDGILPMDLRWPDLAIVAAGALAINLAAGWYPARYAVAVEPAQAVNYEK